MATEKIFFAVEVDSGKAIPELASLQKAITATKESQKLLNKEFKSGKISEDAFAKATSANKVALKSLNSEYNKGAKAAAGLTKKTSGLTKAFNKLGVQIAGAFAARAVFNALSDTLDIVRDFEQANADLAAVLADATVPELEKLENQQLSLGATTVFTAGEIAGLQKELAKLGFTTSEIIASTEAIQQLAAATNTDLARAAEVAASTVKGFGLTANDTQEVVDVMAKSFSSSALDMEKFATAMAIVAPVAKNAGFTIQETTAQIGILADRGVDASTAATALRNIFLENSKAGRSFEEGLRLINDSTDKTKTAFELFGKRGATVATILAENSDEAERLSLALGDAGGAAEEMAETQLDTLNGQMKLLNSAWEGFILSLEKGDGILGRALRNGIGALTEFLTLLVSVGKSEEEIRRAISQSNFTQVLKDDLEEVAFLTQSLTEKGLEENEARESAIRLISQQLEQLKESKELDKEEIARIDERISALKESNKLIADNVEVKEKDVEVTTDLVKLKQEEIKAAKSVSASTEEELAIRNTKVEVLKEELKALQDLRVEQEGFHFRTLEMMEAESLEKMKAIDEDEDGIIKLKENADAELLIEQEKNALILESTGQLLGATQELLNTFTSNKLRNLEKESREELAIINKREEDGLLNEQEAEIARRKLKDESDAKAEILEKKAFKRNKAFNLAEAAINTAGAVAKALNTQPFLPLGPIMAGTAGALGAIQIATIASQKFAKGGIIQGASHDQGGVPVMGGRAEVEGGEIILTKGVTNNPTLAAAANQLNIMGGGKSFLQSGGFIPENFPTFATPEQSNSGEIGAIVDAIADLQVSVNVSEITQAQGNIAVVEQQSSI